jgi:hypothetical protein
MAAPLEFKAVLSPASPIWNHIKPYQRPTHQVRQLIKTDFLAKWIWYFHLECGGFQTVPINFAVRVRNRSYHR